MKELSIWRQIEAIEIFLEWAWPGWPTRVEVATGPPAQRLDPFFPTLFLPIL